MQDRTFVSQHMLGCAQGLKLSINNFMDQYNMQDRTVVSSYIQHPEKYQTSYFSVKGY